MRIIIFCFVKLFYHHIINKRAVYLAVGKIPTLNLGMNLGWTAISIIDRVTCPSVATCNAFLKKKLATSTAVHTAQLYRDTNLLVYTRTYPRMFKKQRFY